MGYIYSSLGFRPTGTLVRIDLQGTEANAFLLDDANYAQYRSGRAYRYFGGHYRASPVHLAVPYASTWHVVVDLGGLAGRIEASIRVVS